MKWKTALQWKYQKTSELQNVSGDYSCMRSASHLSMSVHSPLKTSCRSWCQASSSKMHIDSYTYLWSEKEDILLMKK